LQRSIKGPDIIPGRKKCGGNHIQPVVLQAQAGTGNPTVWIAVSVYVLIAIIKKRLGIKANLYTILQVLSITVFEKTPLVQAVTGSDYKKEKPSSAIQLKLFD
jgi:hypothetical protein